jgi:uncharacterized Zn-finger protein
VTVPIVKTHIFKGKAFVNYVPVRGGIQILDVLNGDRRGDVTPEEAKADIQRLAQEGRVAYCTEENPYDEWKYPDDYLIVHTKVIREDDGNVVCSYCGSSLLE